QRRPGSKLMSVSRPRHEAVAAGVSHALLLHDATVRDVWEALTILEPPIARAAARERSARDLERITAAIEAFAAGQADTEQAVQLSAQVFRRLGEATHNPVLGLAQEPLLRLLEPSLRVMIDKVPQARARIGTAHRRLLDAVGARDQEGAERWMARHIRDFRRGYEIAGIELELRLTAGACPASPNDPSRAAPARAKRVCFAASLAAFRSLWRLAMVALLVMLFLVLALTGYSVAVYNGLVRVRAAVKLAWSDIDVLLVQRHDEL